MRSPWRLNSLRTQLVLLFFAITTAAVVFVYLYVVPQLRSNLTAEKLRGLEGIAVQQSPGLGRAIQEAASPPLLSRAISRASEASDARVTLLAVRPGPNGARPVFVIADSRGDETAILPTYAAAANAVRTGAASTGVERVTGQRTGETAIPITIGGEPKAVAVFSSPLGEVEDNVAVVRRQILIAGAIAIAAALVAAFFASRATTRRLRRLEHAAGEMAKGNFDVEIPVDSRDELGELARTFDEMRTQLQRLDSARKEFIANASHELRTPIFSLGGFVELLSEGDADPRTQEEFVQTMRQQIERLTKLTTDLLDLSRLDADAIEMKSENFDLGGLAESMAREFGPAAEQHHSKLQLRQRPPDKPAVARADPDRVGQIIRILLDNALAHTPEGTAVTLTTLHDNGMAELIVSDEGPGIKEPSLGHVFERFYTGDDGAGSGLGLAIARELATRMGGRLDASSGKGYTAFTLTLPAGGRGNGATT